MPARLLAISDLHLNYARNREAIAALPDHGEDWLILAGDIGGEGALRMAFELLGPRFERLIWVPGNHELWSRGEGAVGVARYAELVAVCREYGVATPEDDFLRWDGPGGRHLIAPCFLLYDYSFRPADIPRDRVLAWAREGGIAANDERFLRPDPYPSRDAWCAARVARTQERLDAAPGLPKVLINHWPLRRDLVRLGRVARYAPWCGTTRTEGWHSRWNVSVVVSGHLHTRATDWKDGVRFEEVSLGYPRHWRAERGAEGYLREILPGPPRGDAPRPDSGPHWHP